MFFWQVSVFLPRESHVVSKIFSLTPMGKADNYLLYSPLCSRGLSFVHDKGKRHIDCN